MRDFSIDLNSEKIYFSKTKEYFDEVIKSYYNESYRSAIVMLYSIAITDLVFKLDELQEIYNDSIAIEILEDVKNLQESSPNSSDWEKKLFKLVYEKTNLLEIAEYRNLQNLQNLRHLCAHPVISQNHELYRPNKDSTRAYIRNVLEDVLIKPPYLSRKIFEDFVADLSTIKNIIYKDSEIETHLKSKYLEKLNSNVILKVFKSMWKVTFKLDDRECTLNRKINSKAINILLKNYHSEICDFVSQETSYFSDINIDLIEELIDTINRYPKIYNLLNDSTKILIKNTIQVDADLDSYAIFLSKTLDKHITKIKKISWQSDYINYHITSQTIDYLYNYLDAEEKTDIANDFIIEMYGKSEQYSEADSRFENLIEKYLAKFSIENFKKLLKISNTNSQIYDRRKASSCYRLIKNQIIDNIDEDFDFSKYNNLK